MGRVLYEDMLGSQFDEKKYDEAKMREEPNSVRLVEDWDTSMEDFTDDFDDYQDLNFPSTDDDY